MTFINYISVSITAVILVVGIILSLYYRKKLKDMDGVIGIIPAEKEEDDDEPDKVEVPPKNIDN